MTWEEQLGRTVLSWADPSAVDPEKLNATSWQVVRRPGLPASEYAHALLLAKKAGRLRPDYGMYLNTLGVAYYRSGHYRAAVETLARAEPLNAKQFGGPVPADLAFLALASHQLGKEDDARTYFQRLREAAKSDRWAKDQETREFLREAETLPGVAGPEKPRP